MKKKFLCLALALAMLLSLVACGNKNDAPADTTPADTTEPADTTTPDDTAEPATNYTELTYDDETIYMNAFQEFYDLYMEASAITDDADKRVAQMAITEAKLLEAGVLFPLSSNGGNYSMGKLAPRTVNSTAWGNDEYRYHNALVTTELIKQADRPEMVAKWGELLGTGEYEQWAKDYLTEKGYELKDTFTRLYSSDPNTWDVLNSYYQSDSEPLVNLYDGLMEYDMENTLRPALATGYDVSDDGLVYTFHIREGAVWTDSQGREIAKVTANDWVAGMQHLLDAKGGLEELVAGVIVGADAYIYGEDLDFANVGVKAVDDYTLEYTLTSPRTYFPTMMAYGIFAPLCSSYYESLGGKFGTEYTPEYTYGTSPDTIAYCGPYLVSSYTRENSIVFQANPLYWNAANINLHTITWMYTDGSDATRNYTDLMAGTIDSAGMNASCVELSKTEGTFDEYMGTSMPDSTSFVGFFNLNRQAFANYDDNTKCVSNKTSGSEEDLRTHAAINNANFRLAMAFGMDRASHNAQNVGEDLKYMSLINSYVPATFYAFEDDVTVDINGTATTFPAASWYGEVMQAQLDADGFPAKVYDPNGNDGAGSGAGFDGWYNPSTSSAYMDKAVEELAAQGLEISTENPIHIEVVYASNSDAYTNRAQVMKQSIESSTGGRIAVDLIPAVDFNDWRSAVYYFEAGKEGNYDLNDFTGWGPDFGDPSTYLDTLLPYGDGSMSKSFGVW